MRALALSSVALLALAGNTMALEQEPLRYTLRFPRPADHYVEVEARVPTDGRPELELMMAVWTPGSYLIREYARHVEQVRARTPEGAAVRVFKTRKNRWRIASGSARSVVVSYRVYGHELGVRSNFVEAEFAFLNGAPTFLTLAAGAPRPHEVRIERPAAWPTALSALEAVPGADAGFRAPDFDTLADSPILLGNPAVYPFEVEGKPLLLANVGEGGVWDGPRSAADTKRIVEATRAFWGFLPYQRYLFFNVLGEASGGLEHKASTLLLASRFKTRTRKGYVEWLSLVSHEHFHAWNVKRLRPVELGPFDYENEAYTKGLWAAEGLTDYYADLILRRAGLVTEPEYLRALSQAIEKVQTTPGRSAQPLEMASFDAWIKQYRPDENTANSAVDYYAKGAVVGFLLDAGIRAASGGAKSLDDVMRLAYERFSGERGFRPEELRATAEQVAGRSLAAFFARALEGTEELDYAEALDWYGLRFKPEKQKDEEDAYEKPDKAWLGVVTRFDGGRILVTQVRRDGPGYEAGFNVDDEILAIGNYRVRPEQWDARLEQYQAGDRVEVLVARRDELVRLPVALVREPPKAWRLELSPEAGPEQKQRLAAWLGATAPTAAAPGAPP